ncbi:MAG: NAD(P)-dependent oxidoreductase [Burkholderiaceae bacterium]|nr:NAD(P)-dependent oxidoreductase [Burkholderiaceae bacterium]
MKKGTVVVTGGSGALGQVVVSRLVESGFDVLSLDRRPHPTGHRRAWVVDLLNAGTLYEASCGAFAIVHLAAHIAPDLASDCVTFNDNVCMTYNVLKAGTDNGVKRIVLASSTAVYGFLYGRRGDTPQFLPATEKHPTLATDPYGLSKIFGERLADAFSEKAQVAITSLRFPGINYDPKFERVRKLLADPAFRAPGFWSYVDVRDAATSVALALARDAVGHRAFNIACDTSNMAQPTAELINKFYPALPVNVALDDSKNWSGIDSTAASLELGFRPQFRWEDMAA